MSDEEFIRDFRAAVRICDAQRRLLVDAGADPQVVASLSAIVRHLHSLPNQAVLKIVDGRGHKERLKTRKDKEAAATADMSIAEVELVLSDPEVARAKLEAIAVGRFQVPKGSLRSLGGIDQLREKLTTLVANERAHETISSVAREPRA